MQRGLTIAGLVLLAVLGAVWALGGLAGLQAAILDGQRQAQSALAGGVRAIKGGQPGALAGLLAVCFAYGVLHAAGPGHGKLVIGGYGMGRRVPLVRLAGLALASSMAQAAVAVALVYGVVALLGLGRSEAEGVAEDLMAPAGLLMLAAVGLWLVWRGGKVVWRQVRSGVGQGHHHGLQDGHRHDGHHHPTHDHHAHDHHTHDHHTHDHHGNHAHAHGAASEGAVCDTCGHAHGPTIEAVEKLTGWRDAALMVAGIALRPCSGALFLLVLTWQLGISGPGIAGVFAMGAGTALVTVGVAGLAVWAREGALASLPGSGAARLLPWLELLAGALVVLGAALLLGQTL